MYVDKLDGLVDGVFFERMSGEWRAEQDRCLREIERHQTADQSYLEEGVQILELAKDAQRLFEKQNPREKRRLLNFLVSNCAWKGGKLTVAYEFTRECLAIRVARRINSFGVIETMADAMLERGVPEHIRSDNGAEMTAKIVRSWLAKLGTKTLYIEPGSPWENGYCESFNGKLRDECLNGEIFYGLKEAIVVLEQWRNQYNTIRPHSSLNYRPPAPQTSTALSLHLDRSYAMQ